MSWCEHKSHSLPRVQSYGLDFIIRAFITVWLTYSISSGAVAFGIGLLSFIHWYCKGWSGVTFALHFILNPSLGFTTHDTGCLSMVTCGGKGSSRKERREGDNNHFADSIQSERESMAVCVCKYTPPSKLHYSNTSSRGARVLRSRLKSAKLRKAAFLHRRCSVSGEWAEQRWNAPLPHYFGLMRSC